MTPLNFEVSNRALDRYRAIRRVPLGLSAEELRTEIGAAAETAYRNGDRESPPSWWTGECEYLLRIRGRGPDIFLVVVKDPATERLIIVTTHSYEDLARFERRRSQLGDRDTPDLEGALPEISARRAEGWPTPPESIETRVDRDSSTLDETDVAPEDKLRLLLARPESESLEFKELLDLASGNPDQVELAKDVAAMQAKGGYLVIGVDDDGRPTGRLSGDLLRHFDEANLRSILRKWIEEPFALSAKQCTLNGKIIVLVHVPARSDGFTIFRSDGYQEPSNRRSNPVFRKGEVFVRHGSSSERWTQSDVAQIRRRIRESEQQRWHSETTHSLIAEIRSNLHAHNLAKSPLMTLSWRLDEDTFERVALDTLRSRDDASFHLLLDRISRDAAELLNRVERYDDFGDLDTLLNRLTCLAAIFVRTEDLQWLERVLATWMRIYDRGHARREGRDSRTTSAFWFKTALRVLSLGGLAVRREQAPAVRLLGMQRSRDLETSRHYNNWLRHAVTMAARSRVLPETRDRRQRGLSFIDFSLEFARATPCVRPDLLADDEMLLDSLVQFDVLWNLAAICEERKVGSWSFYPSFAGYDAKRSDPAIAWILRDPQARRTILLESDDFLWDAICDLTRVARQEGWHTAWEGFDSELVLALKEQFKDMGSPRRH